MNVLRITLLAITLLWACGEDSPPAASTSKGATSAGGEHHMGGQHNAGGQNSGAAPPAGMGGAGGIAEPSDLDCDVTKDDCPEPIELNIGDSYTIYLPAVAEQKDVSKFSAVGTTPQLAVGAVTIGIDDPPGMAHVTVTANVAGSATLTVTLWYGDNKEVERVYNFTLELSNP